MYYSFDKCSNYQYSNTVYQQVSNRIENYMRRFGNLNLLEIGAGEKSTIRTILFFTWYVPQRYQRRIYQKLVDKYFPLVYETNDKV